jgi:starvation-inducible DNA-binding protein
MPLLLSSDDLSEPVLSKVIGLLNSRLADFIDLQTRTKHAPFDMKGPYFSGLHRLFNDINEEVGHNLDSIADRAARLGGTAKWETRSGALNSSLPEEPITPTWGRDQVTALADKLSSFSKNVRQAIGQSNELGDMATANILTRVSRGVDKWLWMVQAHLQEC